MTLDLNIKTSEDMVTFSHTIREKTRDHAKSVVAALGKSGIDMDPVAAHTAQKLAELIDQNNLDSEPPYHNRLHFLEVAAFCVSFVREEQKVPSEFLVRNKVQFTQEDISDCFIAGLIHDLGHPGGSDRPIAFKFESKSWEIAKPTLIEAGYSPERLALLEVMLMFTDPVHGVPVIEAAMKNHVMGASLTSLSDSKIFSALRDHKTAAMAYMLTKADLALSMIPPQEMLSATLRLQEERLQKARDPNQKGVRFFKKDGTLDRNAAKAFLIYGARAAEPFLLNCVKNFLGKPARAALEMIADMSAPLTIDMARPKGPVEPSRRREAHFESASLN